MTGGENYDKVNGAVGEWNLVAPAGEHSVGLRCKYFRPAVVARYTVPRYVARHDGCTRVPALENAAQPPLSSTQFEDSACVPNHRLVARQALKRSARFPHFVCQEI